MEGEHEFIRELIRVYRSCPCLWDKRSDEYGDRQKRADAYEGLVRLCRERYPSANREFVTKKIHNMRCCYMRELRKIGSRKSPDDEEYRPNLWYFYLLSFLSDSVAPKGEDSHNEENQWDVSCQFA